MNLYELLYISVANAAAAAPTPIALQVHGAPSSLVKNPLSIIASLFSSAKNMLALIIGCSAVLYLLYSGFQYITAGGDASKATKARQGIINAVIGLIIIGSTYAIIKVGMSIGMIFDTTTKVN